MCSNPHSKRKLRVSSENAEFIRKFHPHIKKKINSSLKIILLDPYEGKSLKKELEGLRSFRVSKFRIIYRIDSSQNIEIISIGPRRTIYEITLKLLKSGK